MAYQHYDRLAALDSNPLVPLAGNQGLGIVLFSYDGGLYWGLNADRDALPDIHAMVKGLHEEFESLYKAALKS